MSWLAEAPGLAALDEGARAALLRLRPADLAPGTVLFCPGEAARGYVIVLSGRIDVGLTAPCGREMLLYSVEPGQSCIQSTLGLMGDEPYTAEAVVAEPTRAVLLPKGLFLDLMDRSPPFRRLVFSAFAGRMQAMIRLLEKVAFQRIESRLAGELLQTADEAGRIGTTHQDLASRLGTAREVISRRLEAWARRGWIETARGRIEIRDREALAFIADAG